MIRDGRTVSTGATLDFDVCVIGAGPVGAVLSEELSALGFRVGVLESGSEAPAPSTRRLFRGRRSGLPYARLERTRESALGGTSWRWGSNWPAEGGLRSRRLDGHDFEVRSHVQFSGWPISAEELSPWFERAEQRCGIDSTVEPADSAPLLGPHVHTTWCTFVDPSLFRVSESAHRADFITRAHVIGMSSSTGGRTVTSARVGIPGGGWFSVTARTFVLAGGGIENARLLLASEFGRPGGSANPNDQVGRYFMEHLHIESGELRLTPGSNLQMERFSRGLVANSPGIGALQLSAESQAANGLLNSTVEVRSRSPRFLSPGVRSLAEIAWALHEGERPPHLAGHARNVALHPRDVAIAIATRLRSKSGLVGEANALVLTSEQAPNPSSRITLAARRDEFGVPLPHLHWALLPIDTRNIRGTQDVVDTALRSTGVGELAHKWGESSPEPYIHGCNHHIGTTRMSTSAATGVVDSDCGVHGITNLFVAGSSVMPTAGAVTVTLAALALAMRLAEHLRKNARTPPIVA